MWRLSGKQARRRGASGSTLSQMALDDAIGSTSNWPRSRERSMKRRGRSRELSRSALRQSKPCSGL
ncbi:hypothetical protein D3C84_862040 [compost metagenome]